MPHSCMDYGARRGQVDNRTVVRVNSPFAIGKYNSFPMHHRKLLEPVWQGFGFSKNGSSSGFSGGAASLLELEPFCKMIGKIASPVGLRLYNI